jgi:4-hydroxy-4-methyl-2-oxoglutarate aldolase
VLRGVSSTQQPKEATVLDYAAYRELSPTVFADLLTRDRVMDSGIRPLWQGMPRIAGPAYTVRCPPGDNLMLHAAIYRAAPGSIIVVQSGDLDYALAGGNVCRVAQRRGITGFVIDGMIRDVAETRENGFPVFARGVIPIPAKKRLVGSLRATIQCGGVDIMENDVVVADEEGIVVIPGLQAAALLEAARAKAAKDALQSLAAWEADHRQRVEEALQRNGFRE